MAMQALTVRGIEALEPQAKRYEVFDATMHHQASAPRGGPMAQLTGVQVRLAEATMEVEAARLIMQHDLHAILARARRDANRRQRER